MGPLPPAPSHTRVLDCRTVIVIIHQNRSLNRRKKQLRRRGRVSGSNMHDTSLPLRPPPQLEQVLLDFILLRNRPITGFHLCAYLRTVKQLDRRTQPVYIKLLYFLLLLLFLILIVRVEYDGVFVWIEGLRGGRDQWEREGRGNFIDTECERVM